MDSIGLGFILSMKDNASRGLGMVRKQLNETRGATEDLMNVFSAGAAQILSGAGLMAAGTMFLKRSFGAPLAAAASFEMEMAKVNTIAGTTAEGLKGLTKEVERLSVRYGKSQEEMAQGLYGTISAGITDAAEAVKVLDVASKTAVAGITSSATAVSGLTSVLNAYHLGADKAIEVSDAMFTAMKRGKTTMEELASSMGKWTGDAAALGVDYNEALATIAAATLPGQSTESAATGFANVMKVYRNATKQQLDAAKQYGVDLSVEALKQKGLYKSLQEIYEKTGRDMTKLSEIFSDARSGRFIANIMSGEGAQLFSIMEDMKKKAGATEEAYAKIADTFQQRLSVLNSAMSLFGKKIGATLLKPVGYIVDGIRELFRWLDDLPEPLYTLLSLTTVLIGTAVVFGGAILAAAGATRLWGIAVPILTAQLKSMRLGVAGAMHSLSAYLPVIGAIAAAGGLLYLAWKQDWGGIKETVEGVAAGFKMAVSASVDGIARVDAATAKKLQDMGIWDFAIQAGRVFYRVRQFFEGFVEGVNYACNVFLDVVRAIAATAGFFLEPLIAGFRMLLEIFGIFSVVAGSDTYKAIGQIAGAIFAAVVAVKAMITVVKAVTAVQWLFNSALWASPVTWFIAGILLIVAVGYWLVKNWDSISARLSAVWEDIKTACADAKQWIVDKWEGLVDWFKKLPGRIMDAIFGLKDRIIGFFSDMWNSIIPDWARNLIDKISNGGARDMAADFGVDKGIYDQAVQNVMSRAQGRFSMLDVQNELDRLNGKKAADTSSDLTARASMQSAISAAKQESAIVSADKKNEFIVKSETKVTPSNVVVSIDGREIGRAAVDYMAEESMRSGSSD